MRYQPLCLHHAGLAFLTFSYVIEHHTPNLDHLAAD